MSSSSTTFYLRHARYHDTGSEAFREYCKKHLPEDRVLSHAVCFWIANPISAFRGNDINLDLEIPGNPGDPYRFLIRMGNRSTLISLASSQIIGLGKEGLVRFFDDVLFGMIRSERDQFLKGIG